MRRLMLLSLWCAGRGAGDLAGDGVSWPDLDDMNAKSDLRNSDINCKGCGERQFVSVDTDFNKVNSDPELNKHVLTILERLKTFKTKVHPRQRIYFELLKLGMSEHAHRTADSLYVPDKYNVYPAVSAATRPPHTTTKELRHEPPTRAPTTVVLQELPTQHHTTTKKQTSRAHKKHSGRGGGATDLQANVYSNTLQ